MTDIANRAFPSELIGASGERKMLYFRDEVRIEHKMLASAKVDVINAIAISKPGDLVLLCGPTGVGKTTAAKAVAKTLTEGLLDELKTDLERYPVLLSKLSVPGAGYFSWSYNFQRILRAANEPLIHLKIPGRTRYTGSAIPQNERMNVGRYEQAYEKVLEHRRPLAVILDDAHNMGKVPPKRLPYMLDYVWTLAEFTKVPHVLPGTYDLLAIRDLSGQAAHRSIPIHFRRYTLEKEDRIAFAEAVKTLQGKMPVKQTPNFEAQFEYLMERSAGCVGILKEWLDRALAEALLTGSTTVSVSHLKNTTLSDGALAKIFSEIVEGEEWFFQQSEAYGEQLQQMRAPKTLTRTSDPNSKKIAVNEPRKGRIPKPGNRNPNRDEIGRQQHASTAPH